VVEPLAELTRAQPKRSLIKLIQMKADARNVLCFSACIPDIYVKKVYTHALNFFSGNILNLKHGT
jgi:hypothetical protein